MRLALTFAAAVLITTSLSAEVTFKRVWPGYRTAASFVRLGEYFGAAEKPITDAVLRSTPTAREGYYWLVRSAADMPAPGAEFTLEYVLPGAETTARRTFPATIPSGSHTTMVGLTGGDWPDAATRPVAVLAQDQSFLWRNDLPPILALDSNR